jgi:hypothetical protein
MIIGVVIFMLMLAARQKLLQGAALTLTTEEKARVMELSSRGVWVYFVLAFLSISYFAISRHFGHNRWVLLSFMVLVFVSAACSDFARLGRMAECRLPEAYLRIAVLASAWRFIGLLVLFSAMLYDLWKLDSALR